METNVLVFVLLFLVVFLAIVTVALLFLVDRSMRRLRELGSEEGKILSETQFRSGSIIHRAISEANKLLVSAELKGIHLLAQSKITSQDVSREFKEHLSRVEEELKMQLDRDAAAAEASYKDFLGGIEKAINEHMAHTDKELGDRADKIISQTQTVLDAFSADIKGKISQQMEKELTHAYEEIQEYKLHRMRVIDERIIDVLQDILNVTLWKKISLADQSELVYKALEEAKRENAFK